MIRMTNKSARGEEATSRMRVLVNVAGARGGKVRLLRGDPGVGTGSSVGDQQVRSLRLDSLTILIGATLPQIQSYQSSSAMAVHLFIHLYHLLSSPKHSINGISKDFQQQQKKHIAKSIPHSTLTPHTSNLKKFSKEDVYYSHSNQSKPKPLICTKIHQKNI